MWKKLLILSLCISVLFIFSAPISSVNAGGKWNQSKVNWQIAGSIANYVMVAPNIGTGDLTEIPHFLISLSAIGEPGRAEITLMGYGEPVPSTLCKAGEVQIKTTRSDMVARFRDLSLLFASYDEANPGYLCIDFATGHSTFENHLVITGGTRRFEGASGNITGTGDGYYFYNGKTFGPLVGEEGEMTGTIDLPD